MAGQPERSSLIAAAQTGDPVALNRLLVVCRPDARRYALKHCRASDVDDAIQETLLVVSRKIAGLRAAAAFSAWLMTVIRRECQKLARVMFLHDTLDDIIADRLILKTDEALRLDLIAALDSLPAHYLKVLLLRDFEELTISEMAASLDEKPAAIKSRLHRARELVREYLVTCNTA